MDEETEQLLVELQHVQDDLAAAEKICRQILALHADSGAVRMLLAIILLKQERIADALPDARQAIRDCREPSVRIWNQYATILKAGGFLDEAEVACRKVLELDAQNRTAKKNLAGICMTCSRLDAAEAILQELVQEDAGDAVAWMNRARIALHQKDWERAEEYLQTAQKLTPKHPDLPVLNAMLAQILDRQDEAVHYAMQALDGNLVNAEAWQVVLLGLGECKNPDLKHLEILLQRAGAIANSITNAELLAIWVSLCHRNLIWGSLPELEKRLVQILDKPQRLPLPATVFLGLLDSSIPQSAHRHAAEAAWRYYYSADSALPAPDSPPLREIAPLHVGFISSDLRNHAIGWLVVGLMEKLPKGKIIWFAYSNSRDDHSRTRERIRSGVNHFVNMSNLDDLQAARHMRRNRIDVLIDLNGITKDTRASLFRYRPAPLQITWLGMPGTLGAGKAVDYIIGDKWTTPLALADGFDEKILQLPRSYQPNDDIPPDFSLSGTRADHNLPENVPVFCCFNRFSKFFPDTFALWGQIMRGVPNAVLWLPCPDLPAHRERLVHLLEAAGIASTRILFAKKLPQDLHIARLKHADLVLDTLPYNAHTTCSDALRAGTPVLTLPGKTFAGRVAAGILDTAGLAEWIASSPEDYVQKAVRFACLPKSERQTIKAQVYKTYWSGSQPDNVQFGHLLESLCLAVYARKAAGLPAVHLRVTENGQIQEMETACKTSYGRHGCA